MDRPAGITELLLVNYSVCLLLFTRKHLFWTNFNDGAPLLGASGISANIMSEEKVIKHAQNAVHLLKDKSSSIKEKIKGFFEEVFVIIIAVSITLMFHNWNDERHERAIERDFLKGTSEDLKRDAKQIALSIKTFQPTVDYYHNVWKQVNTHKIDAPYVDSLSWNMRNTNYFLFDDSRFEGFKSSGYLRLIENKVLLKHLVTLFSVYMPFEKDADANVFHMRERDYAQYIGIVADTDTAGNVQLSKLLNDKAVRYQISSYVEIFDERKRHKQDLITQLNALAAEIDQELNR